MRDLEWVGMTVAGVVAIICVYLAIAGVLDTARHNADKSKAIRITKIEACKTIADESARTLCIVEGGAGEHE